MAEKIGWVVMVAGGVGLTAALALLASYLAYLSATWGWELAMRIGGLTATYRQARNYKWLFIAWAEDAWASGETVKGGRRIDRVQLAAFLRSVYPDRAAEYVTPNEAVDHAIREDDDE